MEKVETKSKKMFFFSCFFFFKKKAQHEMHVMYIIGVNVTAQKHEKFCYLCEWVCECVVNTYINREATQVRYTASSK